MAYYDREYYRDPGGPGRVWGGGWGQKLLYLLNYSFPIGTYLNIRVRVHITFILLFVFHLIRDASPWWTLRWTSLLFMSVLLHEFGHCLACRRVGGKADDILMWPLGGLAFCDAPKRPWAQFVTVVWGPLVNLILMLGCYMSLTGMLGSENSLSFNPLAMFEGAHHANVAGFLEDLFYVNYILLLFNVLMVFYPFDGGRLVQIALWAQLGYGRSMLIATTVGMAGAVLVGLYGIIIHHLFLLLLAVFGFLACYQQRQMLKFEEAEFAPEFDLGLEYDDDGPRRREGWLRRWQQQRRLQRERQRLIRQRRLEEEVDRILSKISQAGMESLSSRERRLLQRASEQKRHV